MQQDHVESKTDEKSGGAPSRGRAGPEITTQARALLNLQNTAGNRAMAGILQTRAGAAPVQRTAQGAVSVQRDPLMDAIQKEVGPGVIDVESLAKALVRTANIKVKAPSADGAKTAKDATDTSTTGLLSAKKSKKSAETPLTRAGVDERRRKLEERTERLHGGPSQLEQEDLMLQWREQGTELKELEKGPSALETSIRDKKELVEARKTEKTESETLRVREKKLLHKPTTGERANEAKKAQLDDLQKRQEIAELKRKMSGDLTPEEKSAQELDDQLADLKEEQAMAEKARRWERQRKALNPEGKSVRELLGKRKF